MKKKNVENSKILSTQDINVSSRVMVQLSAESMPSLYEAIVEFITNIDDSYERLANERNEKNWKGDCRIEYDLGGIKNSTFISFKDRAEGMDYETLKNNFGVYGERQSGKASRGEAGRGAKDAAYIGDVTVESIFNDKYSKIKIQSAPRKLITYNKNDKVQNIHRKQIGTKKNGTKVTLEIPSDKKRYHTKPKDLLEKIPQHFALQKILEDGNNNLNIEFQPSPKEKAQKLIYKPPEGKLERDLEFTLKNYEKYFGDDAKVIFKVFKSDQPLDTATHEDKRFRHWGICVMGKKAIHEKSLLSPDLDSQPEGKKYFGILKTNLFNALSADFDECRKKGKPHPEYNPEPVIDLKRIDGVNYKHPAIKDLFRIPREEIKKLILKDKAEAGDKEIENKETKKILDDLGKICADLMEDLYEEENPDVDGIDVDVNKWLVIPPKSKIYTGEKRYIYAYTKKESLKAGLDTAFIRTNSPENLEIIESISKFKISKRNKKLIFFKFLVEGLSPKENINLSVYQIEKNICTSSKITVLQEANRNFKEDIEFEKEKYSVKLKRSRNIKIFAKVPDIVEEDLEAKIFNKNSDNVKVQGKLIFKIFRKTNFAIGNLTLIGDKISQGNEINIQINDKIVPLYIDVTPKEEKEDDDQSKFKIQIVKRDFGKTRYQWHYTNPNHLMIAGEHEQVKRYLGKKDDDYPGQNTTAFKCLLAEIISESMVIKRMTLNSRYDPATYENIIKNGSVEDIINNLSYRIEDEKNLFLTKIHERCVKDGILKEEIRKVSSLNIESQIN